MSLLRLCLEQISLDNSDMALEIEIEEIDDVEDVKLSRLKQGTTSCDGFVWSNSRKFESRMAKK